MPDFINKIIIHVFEYKYIIVFVTALLISAILIPFIIKFSIKNGFVDVPNSRKIHTKNIPNIGGVAIFISLFIASLLWYKFFNNADFIFISSGLLILLITGIFDDIKGMKAKRKLYLQIITAIIVVSGGIKITSFYGIFGIYQLPVAVQYLLSVLLIVGVINAYNLIDGIDGLAGSIGLINFGVIGYIFYLQGYTSFAILSFAVSGSLLGFLLYNYNPAKIFMGDTGAMMLGFLIVVLGIKAIQLNSFVTIIHFNSQTFIIMVSALMFLPVFDTLRVLLVRIIKHKSPFIAGKDHIHHLLLKKGLKPREVTLLLITVNIIFIMLGFTINYAEPIKLFANTLMLIL